MVEEAKPPLADEELALPDVQPDRAWAEHLGMPRLIAELEAAHKRIAELEEWVANQFE